MTDRKLMQQALDFLVGGNFAYPTKLATALRERLAQAEPEQITTDREIIHQAVQTVIQAMQDDPGYAWCWHCNIAMAFVDAGGDRYTANQGAARFLEMFAKVHPAHELPAPEQEPVARVTSSGPHDFPLLEWLSADHSFRCSIGDLLYTAPQRREWQALTENEMKNLADTHLVYQVETPEVSGVFDLIRAVAKKLEEKNT